LKNKETASVKELGQLLTCSGLSRPKVSLKVVHGFLIHEVVIFNSLESLSLCIKRLKSNWFQDEMRKGTHGYLGLATR
jgi:hypothetical protein